MKAFRKGMIIGMVLLVLFHMQAGLTSVRAAIPPVRTASDTTPNSNQSTEAGQNSKPDQSTENGQSKGSSMIKLVIDNQNRYDGMDKTYSEGYIPRVEQGTVSLIIPMTCTGSIQNNKLRAALSLGDSQNSPFVNKNYDKTISLQQNAVNDGTGTVEGYVAAFSLELRSDRYNGSYPVTMTVEGTDDRGTEIRQDFTIYVTITDGKDPNEEPTTEATTEEPVRFAPKVLVESCHFSNEDPQAGDTVTAEFTLVNTSRSEGIQNMTVAVSAPGEHFTLLSDSDSIYVGALPAGKTTTVSYDFAIDVATPQGQYDLALTMDYADSKGASYSGSGTGKIKVGQQMHIQFDPPVISEAVYVGDIIEVQVQAMNLGRSKVYNVRAVLEADGLKPEATLFIGDMEAGTVQTGTARVAVSSLTKGNSLYGRTDGIITYYYEDEAGKEYEEQADFSTTITSPFSNQPAEPEDQTGQWWIIIAVIGSILCVIVVIIIIRGIKRRNRQEEVTIDEMVE